MIPEHLEERIKTIPEKPGVYRMKDKNGNVLYVGKSKSLRSRGKCQVIVGIFSASPLFRY